MKQHKFKILFVNFSFYKWHLSIDEFTSETLNRYKIHYIAQSSSIFDQEFFPLVFQRTFSCECATRLKSQMLTSNVMTSYSWGKKASTSRALRTESMSALQSLNVSTKLSKAKKKLPESFNESLRSHLSAKSFRFGNFSLFRQTINYWCCCCALPWHHFMPTVCWISRKGRNFRAPSPLGRFYAENILIYILKSTILCAIRTFTNTSGELFFSYTKFSC